MKVSIIISTHNRANRLKKAIQSVLDQSYQDFEIVVVDDASTDSTEFVAKAFEDKRIKYIKRAKNFGNDTKPKNEGILASTGEYIAFLDDDNTFRPDHLQALLTVLEKEPRYALSYGDRWINDENKEIPPQMGVFSEFDPGVLLVRNYIDTSDVLVRREALFRVGGFDETQKKYIDWNLWVRLAKAGYIFKHVPLVLTDYYLHRNMKSFKVQTDHEKNGEKFVPDWDAYDCDVELPFLGSQNAPRVAIFTLTYDRLDYTKKCFDSLYHTAGYNFDHFVVDNGSSDGTPDWLEKEWSNPLGKTHFRLNGVNKGISIGSNLALEDIGKDYDIIVKVDNDCHFLTNNWLAKMIDIWKSNHMLALSCYVQGLRDNPGGAPRIGQGMIKGELVGMTKHIGGICHFVSASAYDNFRWDDQDFLHGHQDLELSQYLLTQKYQMGYLENFFLEHIEGTVGQEKNNPEYFERRKSEKTTRFKE